MDFSKLQFIVLVLSILNYESFVTTAWEEEDFFKICSPRRCSKHGPEIRFPFRHSAQPQSCGALGMQLSCSAQDTILDHPVLGSCKVTAISYRYAMINVIPTADSSPHCPLQRLISKNLSTSVYKPQMLGDAVLVGCSRDSIDTNQDGIVGPTSCLSPTNTSKFWSAGHTHFSQGTMKRYI
uniref:RING-type E3 ubiquitin transferase n=1 Tax=Leersia perrieri TaxID=77586 RepID=A0A0D9UW29_9ORYZ